MDRSGAPRSIDPTASVFGADAWHGGYFELAVVLGHVADIASSGRLAAAIRAIWQHPSCVGPFDERVFTRSSEPVSLDDEGIHERLYGALQLPYGLAALTTVVVREEQGAEDFDWLYIAAPIGGIAAIHPEVGGYPFGPLRDTDAWRAPLDAMLVDIARRIFHATNFARAYVDFEVDDVDRQSVVLEPGSVLVQGRILSVQ